MIVVPADVSARRSGKLKTELGNRAGEHARDGKGYMTSSSSVEGSSNLPITHYSGLGRSLFITGPGASAIYATRGRSKVVMGVCT